MLKKEQICTINFINWIRENYPLLEDSTIHIANERKCSVIEGRILKRMGVKKNVADLLIAYSRHSKGGLWIEIKIEKNKPTDGQKRFLENMVRNNFAAACCWGLEACIQVLTIYLTYNSNDGYFDNVLYIKNDY
jgi:hypothetical protein